MADKKEVNDLNDQLVEKSNIRRMVDNIRKSSQNASEIIYGSTDNIHDDNRKDVNHINKVINKINLQYKQTTGDNIIEFFDAISGISNGPKGSKKRTKSQLTGFEEITKQLEKPEMYNINELFSVENDRAILYNNYRLIYDNIPQLAQALNTYVDNILSPDDFTKSVFNILIDGKIITSNLTTEDNSNIIENVKSLMKTYKLENLSKEIIRESLKIGDQFVAVLPIKKEISNMLSESNHDILFNHNTETLFSPNEIMLEDDELIEWNNSIIDNVKDKLYPIESLSESATKEERTKYQQDKLLFEEKKRKFKADIAECLNNTFKFYDSADILAEEFYVMNEDFNKEITNGLVDIPFKSQSKMRKDKSKDRTKLTINGSIVKVLDPSKVVKLTLDGICFGYYYMEKAVDYGDKAVKGNYSQTNSIFTSFGNTMAPELPNSKYKLITDIFVKNIGKKINKKFINNNPNFKNTIYTLLRQQYIQDNQINVVYIPPNQVIHFGEGGGLDDQNDYHDSIFKSILYTAKIYLAVQTSTLMLKLVRSPEKRAFYIETDLDQDAEAVVQSFVRDSKTKEIKMESFNKDINTVLNSIGSFQDYYIPVVDGNKPVEIDTIQGMNVEMNNDFLEYLLNTLISGMGIPKEFLSVTDQTEFARSLAMQNGKFVRSIIVKQKVFAEQFTQFIRILYENEFDNSKVDSDKIKIEFPSPASLNMTNLNEQIGNSQTTIQFFLDTLVGEQTDENKEKYAIAKKVFTKEILSNFDWEKWETILNQEVGSKATEEKITKKLNTPDNNPEDMGGGEMY